MNRIKAFSRLIVPSTSQIKEVTGAEMMRDASCTMHKDVFGAPCNAYNVVYATGPPRVHMCMYFVMFVFKDDDTAATALRDNEALLIKTSGFQAYTKTDLSLEVGLYSKMWSCDDNLDNLSEEYFQATVYKNIMSWQSIRHLTAGEAILSIFDPKVTHSKNGYIAFRWKNAIINCSAVTNWLFPLVKVMFDKLASRDWQMHNLYVDEEAMTLEKSLTLFNYINKAELDGLKRKPKPCACCGKETTSLLMRWMLCARCKQVRYCNQACQIKHWTKGAHREACKACSNS